MAPQLSFEYANAYGPKNDNIPIFLRHRGVNGKINLNCRLGEVDKVKVVLKGTLTNTIRHQDGCAYTLAPNRITTKAPIIELSHVHDISSNNPTTSTSADSNSISTTPLDFEFHLSRNVPLVSNPSPLLTRNHASIPSSTHTLGYWCSSSPQRYSCAAQCLVRYHLFATAYKTISLREGSSPSCTEDKTVATLTAEIKLYDTATPVPPPIHLPHFPGEYVVAQSKALRTPFLSFTLAHARTLHISAMEPAPVCVKQAGGITSAAIPLRLVLMPVAGHHHSTSSSRSNSSSSSPASLSPSSSFSSRSSSSSAIVAAAAAAAAVAADEAAHFPRELDIRLTSRLKAHTYFSAGEMLAHPTDADTRSAASPFLGMLSKQGRKFTRTLRVDAAYSHSHSHSSSCRTGTGSAGEWEPHPSIAGALVRTLTVLVPVLENEMPPPTYFTGFLARRYSVAIGLAVDAGGWKRAGFRLCLPVQIVYPDGIGAGVNAGVGIEFGVSRGAERSRERDDVVSWGSESEDEDDFDGEALPAYTR